MEKESLKSVEKELETVLSPKEVQTLMEHYKELSTLSSFYNKIKNLLVAAHNYSDKAADFETYRWILQNTDKSPREFLTIFHNIPKKAQKNIIKYLGYKTEATFKKTFAKHLGVYSQSVYRRESKEGI